MDKVISCQLGVSVPKDSSAAKLYLSTLVVFSSRRTGISHHQAFEFSLFDYLKKKLSRISQTRDAAAGYFNGEINCKGVITMISVHHIEYSVFR